MATTERLSVRLSADTISELRNAAMVQHRTVAGMARLVMDTWATERAAKRKAILAGPDKETIERIQKVPDEWTDPDPFDGTPQPQG